MGPAIKEAFARRAGGEEVSAIARSFESRRLPAPLGGERWMLGTVRSVLSNRVYLGEVRSGVYVKQGAHEPLTDPATWERAQLATERVGRRHRGRPSLLTGLVRCAGCRGALHATPDRPATGAPGVVYRCTDASSAGRCPARAGILSSVIEPHVVSLALARARVSDGGDAKALAAAEDNLASLGARTRRTVITLG